MRNCRLYWNYRRKAKGRHGTHAPFVYAFVEQVLRKGKPVQQHQIIQFLKEQKIIEHSRQISLTELSAATQIPENTLWIVEEKNFLLDLWSPIQWPMSGGLLVWQPHARQEAHHCWQALRNSPKVSRSIDAWHFGLLLQAPAFKQKQHFYLR